MSYFKTSEAKGFRILPLPIFLGLVLTTSFVGKETSVIAHSNRGYNNGFTRQFQNNHPFRTRYQQQPSSQFVLIRNPFSNSNQQNNPYFGFGNQNFMNNFSTNNIFGQYPNNNYNQNPNNYNRPPSTPYNFNRPVYNNPFNYYDSNGRPSDPSNFNGDPIHSFHSNDRYNAPDNYDSQRNIFNTSYTAATNPFRPNINQSNTLNPNGQHYNSFGGQNNLPFWFTNTPTQSPPISDSETATPSLPTKIQANENQVINPSAAKDVDSLSDPDIKEKPAEETDLPGPDLTGIIDVRIGTSD